MYLYKKYCSFFIIIMLTLVVKTQSQPASLSISVEKNTLTIGDQTQLTLKYAPFVKGTNVIFHLPDSLKGWEIVDTGKIDTVSANNALSLQQNFIITAFDSGKYVIPPFAAQLSSDSQKLKSNTLDLFVNTIDVDTTKPFKDIKDIVQVEEPGFFNKVVNFLANNKLPIAAIIIGLIMIAALLWYFLFYKKKQTTQLVYETPYQKSWRMLQELDEEHLYEQGKIKEHYSQLSDILRAYFEAQFGLNAMEQTTDELIKSVKHNSSLRKIRPELKRLLQTADLAKFAKANPMPEEHRFCVEAAYSILKRTKPEETTTSSAK